MDRRSSLPVEFLFAMRAELGTWVPIEGGPQGSRLIVNVVGGTFEGPRLRGRIEPPGGDWLTRRPDGTGRLDVRVTLRTDDGAAILMAYSGITRPTESGTSIRTAPLFETGDPRYAWLNAIQAVGVGGREGATVSYDVYALQ
jgi:hypothetical protein